ASSSASPSACTRGTTSRCPGVIGLMSRNATTVLSAYAMLAGAVPAAIRQKTQLTRQACQVYLAVEVRLGRCCPRRPDSGPRRQDNIQEDRDMRYAKTWAVAAGAAAVLGGLGVGAAQAAGNSSPAAQAAVTSSAQTSREAEARGRVAEGEAA